MSNIIHQWSPENPGHTLNNRPSIVNQINGDKRYYSALDAELYFGNLYIDEITDIAYSMTQNTLPIFGFNSYTFDDLAVGNRFIQGQFNINYTSSNFLTGLQNNEGFKTIARNLYGKDNPKTSKFSSDYRKRLNLPVWDKGFDIVIGYGYHGDGSKTLTQNKTQSYIVLETCQITGVSSMLNSNGEPVQETYSFVARDLRHVEESGSTNEITDNNTEDNVNKAIYSGSLSKITMAQGFNYVLSLNYNGEDEIGATIKESKFNFVTAFENKVLNESKILSASGMDVSYTFNEEESKSLDKEIQEDELEETTVHIYIEQDPIEGKETPVITEHVKVDIK